MKKPHQMMQLQKLQQKIEEEIKQQKLKENNHFQINIIFQAHYIFRVNSIIL